MKRALIFCWSESDRYPCEIREDDYIICADSGFKYAERLGVKPDILLGDFDSYSAVGNEAENVITLPTEKDDTDAMYAAKVAMAKGFDEIILAGGIGGREDHTKGAVSVLKFIRKKCKGFISDGYTRVDVVNANDDVESIINTVLCNATKQRQEEVIELSRKVKTMVIIGSKTSSNSNKLYEISKKYCNNVIFIETKEELDLDVLDKKGTIGIMAGASTPQKSIDEVVEKIKEIC